VSTPRTGVRATVRWRLTVLYGALFLLAGLILLGVSYAIVRANIEDELGREREEILTNLVEAGADPSVVEGIANFRLADDRTVSEVLADSARDVRSEALDELVVAYAIAIPATMLLALLLGWWAAGRALAPVKRLTAAAQQISERNLDQRIALDGPQDELKELADTLDALLARLDVAFQSQRRFAADVSHEIRTPLAIVKAEAEVTLGDGLSGERERRLARAVLRATDRAEALVASLLALGRSDSTMLARDVVDLAELAGDVVGERIEAADRAGVQLELDLGSAVVVGDQYLLERLLANLVDNGIVHNRPEGGWLRIAIDTTDSIVALEVENSGPALDQADVDRITEPFLRLSEDRPGFGLGMAIVRSVVAAHDGTVRLRARPEGGLAVRVELPAQHHPTAPLPRPLDSRV
jgi:signal transduction histidine kinase